MDKRECVVGRSVEVDWNTNRWSLAPNDGCRIGAGFYVCMPYETEAEALAAATRMNAERSSEN